MRRMNATLQAHREHVGRQIRKARGSAGLSLDRLAAAVGSSRQHLIKLEKGQHLAGDAMLSKIAEATGKTVDFFTGEADAEDEESDPVTDLLQAIRRLVREEMKAA